MENTELTKKIRGMKEYATWRSKIVKMNDCCENCGVLLRDFQIHHKKQMKLIIIENNLKTIEDARACEELWDLDNGEALCSSCHFDNP